jgi:hypothetical protein
MDKKVLKNVAVRLLKLTLIILFNVFVKDNKMLQKGKNADG